MMPLRPGDLAPLFETTTTEGTPVSLAALRGKKVVLYFYPMDGTPACTAQACSLRDYQAEIAKRGAVVFGVSSQSKASHERFTQKHRLNFALLNDAKQSIATAYGATGTTTLGKLTRRLFGINQRITYIIDENGRIMQVLDDPRWGDHGAEVLKCLEGSTVGESK